MWLLIAGILQDSCAPISQHNPAIPLLSVELYRCSENQILYYFLIGLFQSKKGAAKLKLHFYYTFFRSPIKLAYSPTSFNNYILLDLPPLPIFFKLQ